MGLFMWYIFLNIISGCFLIMLYVFVILMNGFLLMSFGVILVLKMNLFLIGIGILLSFMILSGFLKVILFMVDVIFSLLIL